MGGADAWRERPFRTVAFRRGEADLERRGADLVLRNRVPLPAHPPRIGDWLAAAAATHPERLFLAERDGDGWRRLSYGAVAAEVDALAQGLLDAGVGKGSIVAAISPNSIAMAVLQLAAISIGAVFAPVSPNYAEGRSRYDILKGVLELLRPALLYVADLGRFGDGVAAAGWPRERTVEGEPGLRAAFAAPTPALGAARMAVGPDDTAKILLTSGSTGLPKGVINTHRMTLSNQAAIAAMWPFLRERPPTTCCWLPWNHTMGGNFSFFMMLANGGAFNIDDGRPTPEGIARTAENLTAVRPTIHFNVPSGLDALLPYLERSDVAEALFGRLDALCFAGSALPAATWARLNAAAASATGHRVHIVTSWGATETGPAITLTGGDAPDAAFVGLPLPGVAVKLAPVERLTEGCVAGPSVMPGYLGARELTEKAFDGEGYYRSGDAMSLVRDGERVLGLSYGGRVVENFKLGTGTWVEVGALRVHVLSAAAPLLQDCVIAGEGESELGLLGFLNLAQLRQALPESPDDPHAAARDPLLRGLLISRLAAFNAANPGATRAIRRVLLEPKPPSAEAGEIADKGYVNQRAVLRGRAAAVERLFSDHPDVIRVA